MLSIVAALVVLAAVPAGSEPGAQRAGLPVVQERDGLPNVFARLRQGKPTTIVYLGGSITAGGGASQPESTSYRAIVGKWFSATFAAAKVSNVNAAIGGTGSDLGAFRTARDVLARKPNLVFVEFAVNDGGTPDAMILRSMEGIVRQIRRADPSTDICFVYTFVVGWLADFRAGQPVRSVGLHEQVAARYGIPSVNVAVPAARRLIDGAMTEAAFAADGVHPTDAGYAIYGEALVGFLDRLRKGARRAAAHRMPGPIRPDSLEHATMMGPDDMGATGAGWRIEGREPTGAFPRVLVGDVPGAETSVRSRGPMLAMFYVLGPDTGAFDYRIDEGEWTVLDPFDQWAKEWPRAHYRLLADGLNGGAHTLHLRVRAGHHADSKGTVTRIGYLLVNGTAEAGLGNREGT